MNLKLIGGIVLGIIFIVVIIVLVVYRKSFFSKKSSESTTNDNEKESSTDSGVEQQEVLEQEEVVEEKEVEAPTVTEEESDETDFEEENITGRGGTNYEVDEQEEENELQPNEWLAYRNHWNLEGDKVISKSETFLKKEEVNSSELADDLKIQITVGMEATYIRQLNNDYYIVNYQTSDDYQTEIEEEYYDETEYYNINNYCAGDTDRKNIFINAASTKFSTTENNSDECRNLCSQTTDCEMYLNKDENTCYLYKDVDDITMYCESGPGHTYYGNAKIKDGVHPAYEINSETSSEVIDNILEKEGWEISTDISISDTSNKWRNLFHYGNGDGTRVPAMWIIPNQHWKLHFRIKTTTNWNDGLNFFVPEDFRNPGETFNVRIRYERYDTYSKIIVYVNDVFVTQQEIGIFTPVENQQFDLKKSWGDKYTDKENYTISNFTLRKIPRTWE